MVANIFRHIENSKKENKQPNEFVIRHMILETLLKIKREFKDYGKIILCCDSKSYWRREYFPNYKIHRRSEREKSKYDWDFVHSLFNKFKDEIKEYLPYYVIDIDGTEADDVIAVFSKEFHTKEQILIYSTDKDFFQLQKYPNIFQYGYLSKNFLKSDDPKEFLKEHIIKGDSGDGIPNILSDDDCIINGKRQNKITRKFLETTDYENLSKYKRNDILINFDNIPKKYEQEILRQFENYKTNSKMKLFDYCVRFNLKKIQKRLQEF